MVCSIADWSSASFFIDLAATGQRLIHKTQYKINITNMTDRFNAVVLLWFSVGYIWCQSLGDVSPYVCSYYIIFRSIWVAERPSFGKELLNRLTVCSLCILTICNLKLCTHDQDLRIRKFCIYANFAYVSKSIFLLCVHMAFKDQQNLSKVEVLFY